MYLRTCTVLDLLVLSDETFHSCLSNFRLLFLLPAEKSSQMFTHRTNGYKYEVIPIYLSIKPQRKLLLRYLITFVNIKNN